MLVIASFSSRRGSQAPTQLAISMPVAVVSFLAFPVVLQVTKITISSFQVRESRVLYDWAGISRNFPVHLACNA